MPFMRSHEARPGTDPPMSELWEESTLLCPQSKLWGGQSISVPLIYATDCKSCITSCQLAGCLLLDFPCQRRLFLTFDCMVPHLVLTHWFLNYSSVESKPLQVGEC